MVVWDLLQRIDGPQNTRMRAKLEKKQAIANIIEKKLKDLKETLTFGSLRVFKVKQLWEAEFIKSQSSQRTISHRNPSHTHTQALFYT